MKQDVARGTMAALKYFSLSGSFVQTYGYSYWPSFSFLSAYIYYYLLDFLWLGM